jgi:hypothetical protein
MRRAPLVLIGCVLLAGCGSSTHRTTTSSTTEPAATTRDPTAQLEQAVRSAVNKDHSLSVETLWTNTVPANPQGIAGPALNDLRQAVAQRRRQGLRVRMLSDDFHVLNVSLEPSYTTATATVLDAERVQVTDPKGHPRGKPSATRERVRLELHRLGSSENFAVWKVSTVS